MHETPVDDFEHLLRLNLRPTYLTTQAALPHLMEAGGGSIVAVSARAAFSPFAGAAGYIAAKSAVWALVSSLAVEYKEDGIRVNAILPSVIDTPANREDQPDSSRAGWVPPSQPRRRRRLPPRRRRGHDHRCADSCPRSRLGPVRV